MLVIHQHDLLHYHSQSVLLNKCTITTALLSVCVIVVDEYGQQNVSWYW